MSFQYANVPTKFKEFMGKLRRVGVPDKATTRWLASIGYKSNNDRNNLKVLNFIGFIDNSSTPTEKWLQYRGANYKSVLGNAVKEGYSELFKTYPNANELEDEVLDSYFSTKTTAGKQVVSRLTRTFKALVELSDFDDNSNISEQAFTSDSNEPIASMSELQPKVSIPATALPTKSQGNAPTLHIDVQIHISSDVSADQIDQIFASMAKHLYAK